MRKRTRRRPANAFLPFFAINHEMVTLMLQTSEMLASSGEVITKRSHMIGEAMAGRLTWTNPEFSRLWQEKLIAHMEACHSINVRMMKHALSPNKSAAKNSLEMIKTVTAFTRPYHRKARANARRLRK